MEIRALAWHLTGPSARRIAPRETEFLLDSTVALSQRNRRLRSVNMNVQLLAAKIVQTLRQDGLRATLRKSYASLDFDILIWPHSIL